MKTLIAFFSAALALAVPPSSLDQHDMTWEIAPTRWLEGVPLANGRIGAMVWGNGSPIKITLDKYDAWETRERVLGEGDITYAELRRLVAEGKRQEVEASLFRALRVAPRPTRLPMPRVEINPGPNTRWLGGRLNLRTGTAFINLSVDGAPLTITLWTHAKHNFLFLRMKGPAAARAAVSVTMQHLDQRAQDELAKMGRVTRVVNSGPNGGYLHSTAPAGYEYAVAWRRTTNDAGEQGIGVSLVSGSDASDPLAAARAMAERACRNDGERNTHVGWWGRYWERSSLAIPDAGLEALYYVEMYKLGASTQPGGYPITLQGLWTLDGGMPPWAGDYHLDMNVQQTYWPVYASNRLELGEPLYRTFFECLPRWQRQCRQFFGFEGIWTGCAIGPRGERVWGYTGAELWPGNGAWLAHHYWLHFLYSRDTQFLQQQALPFIRLAFLTYANLLEAGADNKLHVPLSYSPEWGEGSMEALVPDPTCDLALIRFLGEAILESHRILKVDDGLTARAHDVLKRLVDYPQSEDRLLLSPGRDLSTSHRHHSHLMAIYPLGLLSMDGNDSERKLIEGSLAEIRSRGTAAWTGWAFPWMSLIASRARNGNMAWQMLDLYRNLFIKANTLHVNGDPRMFGPTRFTYEPMTLEGGFGAAAAVMEMLLQSHHGRIRLFPSIPDRWHDAYFRDLRAEGAFLVTAKLARGSVTFVTIKSEAGLRCEVSNPFRGSAILEELGAPATSQRRLEGDVLRFPTKPGARYLLYPANRRPGAKEMEPSEFLRTAQDHNFYGLKQFARF